MVKGARPLPALSSSTPVPPIVKWAGGKRQLLSALMSSCPVTFNRYFEPFAGGAALFFALACPGSYLSDTNGDLMQLYETVRDHMDPLVERLRQIQTSYRRLSSEAQATFFYELRQRYNERTSDSIEQSALFLALNRLAFNGLYRLNGQGAFNTPYGRYKNPDLVRANALLSAHLILQHATLATADYTAMASLVRHSDFCYIDPPYVPTSKTANFTSYTVNGFGWDDQVALAQFIRDLAHRGVYVMTSNANVPAIHELYHDCHIQVVPVRRAINSDATKRSGATEVLITTYPVPSH